MLNDTHSDTSLSLSLFLPYRAQSTPQYFERPATAGSAPLSENYMRSGTFPSRPQLPMPSISHSAFPSFSPVSGGSNGGGGGAASIPQGVTAVHAPQPRAPNVQNASGDWMGTERQTQVGQTPPSFPGSATSADSRPSSASLLPSRSSGDGGGGGPPGHGSNNFLPNGHTQPPVRQRI